MRKNLKDILIIVLQLVVFSLFLFLFTIKEDNKPKLDGITIKSIEISGYDSIGNHTLIYYDYE